MEDNQKSLFHPYINISNSINMVGLKARLILRNNDLRIEDNMSNINDNNDEDNVIQEEGDEKQLIFSKKKKTIARAIKARIQRHQLQEMKEKSISEIIVDEKYKVNNISQTKEKAENKFYNAHCISYTKRKNLPLLSNSKTIVNDSPDLKQSISCSSTRHIVSDNISNSHHLHYRDILLGNIQQKDIKEITKINFRMKKVPLASINEEMFFKKLPIIKRNKSTNRYESLNKEGSLYHSLFNSTKKIMKYGMFNLSSLRTSIDLKKRVNSFVSNINKHRSVNNDTAVSNYSSNYKLKHRK